MSDYIAEQYAKRFVQQLIDSSDYLLWDAIIGYMDSDAVELQNPEFDKLMDSIRNILSSRIVIKIN